MTSLAALLDDTARDYPHRTAIVCGQDRRSYSDINAESNQVASFLSARGMEPGDKVALSCPNSPQFTIAYFGILKIGATVVPLNVLLKAREIAYHLADSDSVAYVAYEGNHDLPIGDAAHAAVKHLPEVSLFIVPTDASQAPWAGWPAEFTTHHVDDDSTAVILYTSGTTGQPKGAALRHRNMRDNARASSEVYQVVASRPDSYLCALPLFHSFGQTCMQNGAIACGGKIVMLPRFEPFAALTLMVDEAVTVFAGVPTMYWSWRPRVTSR